MLSPASSQMSTRKEKCVLVFMGKSDSEERPVDGYFEAGVLSEQRW